MATPSTAPGARRSSLLRSAFPGVDVLRHYDRAWLRGDVLGGVTVAAYMVPQVMAYAVVAGLDPVVGLWAVVGPLAAYVVFGSSRQLSIGPESTTALMTAAAVAGVVGTAGPERATDVAAALAVAVSVVCVIGWLARLGFIADLLSKPMLVGFMTGIAILMITSQLDEVLGVTTDADLPHQQVLAAVAGIGAANPLTLVVSGLGLVLLFSLRAISDSLPGPLVYITVAALASWAFNLGGRGVELVGSIPQGMPEVGLPDLSGIGVVPLFVAALGITLVGYSDVVLVGRSFAAQQGHQIDANQEFLALGAANLAAGMGSAFPVSCSGSRTALGVAMGTRTQLHSLVAALVVVAVLFVGGPVLAVFPSAALGAVVIYAAVRLVDVADWRRIARFRRSELVLAILTAVGVIAFGVLQGIAVAVGLSILNLLRRLARPHDGILGRAPGVAGMHDVDDYPDAVQVPGLVVYRYDAPLFFANAGNFITRALQAVDSAPTPARWLLINAEANVEVDITAIDVLQSLQTELKSRGVVLALARVKQDLRDDLEAAGFIDLVGEEFIFPTLPTAEEAYEQWSREQPADQV